LGFIFHTRKEQEIGASEGIACDNRHVKPSIKNGWLAFIQRTNQNLSHYLLGFIFHTRKDQEIGDF
jgi:hypothetical protein